VTTHELARSLLDADDADVAVEVTNIDKAKYHSQYTPFTCYFDDADGSGRKVLIIQGDLDCDDDG
jgi:hypothetical protein